MCEAGLEVRLRDFDDQDNDFSVRKFDLFEFFLKKAKDLPKWFKNAKNTRLGQKISRYTLVL